MSVFCSKTLILAPECWKCIVRGLDFKNFPRGRGGGGWGKPLDCPGDRCKLFPSPPSSKLLPPTKNLTENLITHDYIHRNQSKIKQKGHLNCSITQPVKTDLFPCSLPLGDVSWKGTSATQWQTLHTDDAKSVWNLVINTDCMMEYSHSFSKDLQWNNQSQLMEHDVPRFQGFAFVMNGGTCAIQWAMNVHLYNNFVELQWKTGTKVKMLQHCLIHLSHLLWLASISCHIVCTVCSCKAIIYMP